MWDTRRERVADRWETGDADVAFSPDGRWLVSSIGGSAYSGAECVFWKVGTWERGPSIPLERTTSPSNLAFSDDGRMLVVARTMTELLLLDPRDLHELARLQPPESTIETHLRFSPDGGFLLAGTTSGFIHVWDLRRIRARLEDLGLDWDLPPLGPPPGVSASEPPLDVEVRLDPTSLIQRANDSLEHNDYRRAVADFEEALAGDPGQPRHRSEPRNPLHQRPDPGAGPGPGVGTGAEGPSARPQELHSSRRSGDGPLPAGPVSRVRRDARAGDRRAP